MRTQGSCRTNQSGPSTLLRGKPCESAGLGHPLRRGSATPPAGPVRAPLRWRGMHGVRERRKDRDYRAISLGDMSTLSMPSRDGVLRYIRRFERRRAAAGATDVPHEAATVSRPLPPDLQKPFDVGIVMTTIVRPSLGEAYGRSMPSLRRRSHPAADRRRPLAGRPGGRRAAARRGRPMAVEHARPRLFDVAAQRRALPSHYGGALKTILSYAANSAPRRLPRRRQLIRPRPCGDDVAAYRATHGPFRCAGSSTPTTATSCRRYLGIVGPGRGVYPARKVAGSSTRTAFSSTSSRATMSFRNGR